MYVCISTSLVYANDEVSQHVAIIAFYAGQYAHGGETGHAAIEKAHSRRTSFKSEFSFWRPFAIVNVLSALVGCRSISITAYTWCIIYAHVAYHIGLNCCNKIWKKQQQTFKDE